MDDDDPEDEVPAELVIAHRRRLDWTGNLWPAEPATEPKLMQHVEGTSSWPIEPATEPKMRMVDGSRTRTEFRPEPPSIQVSELPVEFVPSSFDDPTGRDNLATEQNPIVVPQADAPPVRPTPRPRRPPPAPFRAQRDERAPAPGSRADRIGRPDTSPVPRLQLADAASESRPFQTESDTISENDPFDDE